MRNPQTEPVAPARAADALAPQVASSPPVELQIVGARTKLQVQAWSPGAATSATAQAVLGTAWPTEVGAAAGQQVRALCYSPVDWLVVSDEAPREMLARLETAVGGSGASLIVTDQSQGLGAIAVRGPKCRELLSKACGLDVHPRVFVPGSCARTRLAHVPVLIDVAIDGAGLTCYVARSYLEYLHRWLADAAAEYQEPRPEHP